MVWPAVAAAVSAYGQYRANKETKNYLTGMSNTGYKRAMADMRAAGLNPILAGKLGPATTPNYQAQNIGSAFTTGYQQASSAEQMRQQTKQIQAQTKLTKQQEEKLVQEIKQMKDLHNERWQRLFATMGPDNIAASVAAAINNVDVKLLLNHIARKTDASINTLEDLERLLRATQAQKSGVAATVSGIEQIVTQVFKPTEMRDDKYSRAARGN